MHGLASWRMHIEWGQIDYTDPVVQMSMARQLEDILEIRHIAGQVETRKLWTADLSIWASRHCRENFDRKYFDVLECGRDKVFVPDSSTCSATWKQNTLGLKEKIFRDVVDPNAVTCYPPGEGGICRPGSRMHPDDMADLGLDPLLFENEVFLTCD